MPSDLQNRIAVLGGRIIDTFPEIKVVLIADLTDEAAALLASQADVADVTLDGPLVTSEVLCVHR